MHVGRPDEPGRGRGSRGEVSGLAVPGGHVAGQPVIPTAGFGGREAHHDSPPAVPIARHGVGTEPRRAELHAQFDSLVRLGMAGRIRIAELENQLAWRVGGRVVARLRRLRPKSQWKEGKNRGSPCHKDS